MSNINWFPGHMAKATREIEELKKQIDLVIEVVDARAIKLSSNNDLIKIFNCKKMKVALKRDLADLDFKKNNQDQVIIGSIKNRQFKQKVISKMYDLLSNEFASAKKKGLLNPRFNVLVIGLPNIGKSSLINLLLSKNHLNVENRPGVTKKINLVKINEHFYLNDSPGIFYKKIDDLHDGYTLALINCIKKEVLDLNELNMFAYDFYQKNYQTAFNNFFKINQVTTYHDFCSLLAEKNGFYLENKNIDQNRLNDYLYKIFVNNKICLVNYEK